MATIRYPIYTARVGSGYEDTEFNDTDCIPNTALPTALPPVWASGARYDAGDTVFHDNRLWIAQSTFTSGTAPSTSNSQWEPAGSPLISVGGDNRTITPTNDAGVHGLHFTVNQGNFSSPTFNITETSIGSNEVNLELRLPNTEAGVNSAGNGLAIANGAVTFDYADPEALVRLISQARSKTLVFANGLPDTATVILQNPVGEGTTTYFVDYTFTDGLPSQIDYYEGTDTTGTLRARKTLTFVNGLPQTIIIGAS